MNIKDVYGKEHIKILDKNFMLYEQIIRIN